ARGAGGAAGTGPAAWGSNRSPLRDDVRRTGAPGGRLGRCGVKLPHDRCQTSQELRAQLADRPVSLGQALPLTPQAIVLELSVLLAVRLARDPGRVREVQEPALSGLAKLFYRLARPADPRPE